MKLSELKKGDDFKFWDSQIVKYKVKNRHSYYFQEMITTSYESYEVLKKNTKSVKCRVIFGQMEYEFSFDGVDCSGNKGVDVDVELLKNKIKLNVKDENHSNKK